MIHLQPNVWCDSEAGIACFIFVPKQDDGMVIDCAEPYEKIGETDVSNYCFKEPGADGSVMAKLVKRIEATGLTSCLDVVSTTIFDDVRTSICFAAEIGVDRVHGGGDVTLAFYAFARTSRPLSVSESPSRPFDIARTVPSQV